MWKPVCLTIVATAGNNIGKVLQKKGTLILPPLSFKCNVIRTYASNRIWITGFLMDIVGAGLMLLAISQAPVSVVQPVSGCGLAILSVFSHFYLKEIMNVIDWIGIALAGTGTIGVGFGGEEQISSSVAVSRVPLLAFIITFLFVGIFSMLGVIYLTVWFSSLKVLLNGWLRLYRRKGKAEELAQYDVVEEIIYGVGSGILFGISSVISKIGFVLLNQGFSKFVVPICISISILCSTFGFVYQTRGLKHGRAIVVSTCGAVASIVTGVLSGMYALGEELPSAPLARMMLLLGWLFIILGVILLVTSNRLLRCLRRRGKRVARNGIERRSASSSRARETNPSAVIQASTLHHLISSASKEKP